MLMTMGEFAEEYGVTRNYVNYAVKMAKLQPVERGPMVYGHSAGMYEERELANAVKNYYIGLRDNIKAKAERWHNEALGVKRHYERRNRRHDEGHGESAGNHSADGEGTGHRSES